jgi:hypothetical protein
MSLDFEFATQHGSHIGCRVRFERLTNAKDEMTEWLPLRRRISARHDLAQSLRNIEVRWGSCFMAATSTALSPVWNNWRWQNDGA